MGNISSRVLFGVDPDFAEPAWELFLLPKLASSFLSQVCIPDKYLALQILFLLPKNPTCDSTELKQQQCRTRAWSLLQEDSTYTSGQLSPRATTTEPTCCNYWSPHALESKRSHCNESPRTTHNQRKPESSNEDPGEPRNSPLCLF